MTNTIAFPAFGLEFTLNRVAFSPFGLNIYWYGIIIAFGFLLAVLYATCFSTACSGPSPRRSSARAPIMSLSAGTTTART